MVRRLFLRTVLSAAVVLLSAPTFAGEVGLVALDLKDVAKGYRGEDLKQNGRQ